MNKLDPILIEKFKRIIAENESAGGTNFNHQQLKSGPLKGQTAAGSYGIVPGTLIDYVKKATKLGIPVDEDIKNLANRNDYDNITQEINKNPSLNSRLGDLYSKTILQQNNGDVEMSALNHRFGHNYGLDKKEELKQRLNKNNEDWYLKRFGNLLDNKNHPIPLERKPTVEPIDNDAYEQMLFVIIDYSYFLINFE